MTEASVTAIAVTESDESSMATMNRTGDRAGSHRVGMSQIVRRRSKDWAMSVAVAAEATETAVTEAVSGNADGEDDNQCDSDELFKR